MTTENEPFTDIKITGADEGLTNAPDPSRPAMYDVYLTLSDAPPSIWVQAFEQAWQHRLYMKKRRARIEGDHLVIHCPLDEIENDHKPELLAVFSEVNQEYKKYAAQQALRQKQVSDQQAAADKKKKDALGGLKFD